MFLVYNDTLLDEAAFALLPDNRGLHYGDGLFETIRYQASRVWFQRDHINRLRHGLDMLYLTAPTDFPEQVFDCINNLLKINQLLNQTVRLKLQVWRKPGGLYTPASAGIDWLLTARPGPAFSIGEKNRVGISQSVRLAHWRASAVKTLSALPYVLAGAERQQRGFDELILCHDGPQNNLAECTAANLFWFSDGALCTPSLETGCVDGVLRQNLLRLASTLAIPINENFFVVSELSSAEAVFCTNVNGIHWLRCLDGVGPFPAGHPAAQALFNALLRQEQG